MAAAWRLREAGRDVHLYESGERLGGVMKTRVVDGFTFETGPNTVRSNSRHLVEWLGDLGLGDSILESDEASKRRFIWRNHKLHEVPTGAFSFLKSGLLSWKGKMRLRAEKKQPVAPDGAPETLRQFFDRRIGPEATSAFVDPFVAGVYAGSADELGTDAFPMLKEMEKIHGSLLKALRVRKKEGQGVASIGLIGLQGGWDLLPTAVHEKLGGRIHCNHRLSRVSPKDGGGFLCYFETAEGEKEVRCEELVIAVPAYEAARLMLPWLSSAASSLAAIPHPHVGVVGLGFKREQIEHPLDGFGLLVPSDDPLPGAPSVLGVLFPSSIFPKRTPEGSVSLLVMLGGSRDPSAADVSDHALEEQAISAVRRVLGVEGRPQTISTIRWKKAIPQYLPGHAHRMRDVREELKGTKGLVLAGNYLSGVSVEAVVESGFSAASQLLGEA